MFTIGLEFSLPKLVQMRRLVLGLGGLQVVLTTALFAALLAAAGSRWQGALALGAALAMSSTAIVVRLLAERMQTETPHGREVIGVLLAQDLAVVPLLVLVPALAGAGGRSRQRPRARGAQGGGDPRRGVLARAEADAGRGSTWWRSAARTSSSSSTCSSSRSPRPTSPRSPVCRSRSARSSPASSSPRRSTATRSRRTSSRSARCCSASSSSPSACSSTSPSWRRTPGWSR